MFAERNPTVRYEVYVDVLFANCLITDYWILSLTGMILRRSATRRRILLSAACGAFLTLLLILALRLPQAVLLVASYGVIQPFLLWSAYRIRRMQEFFCGCACMFFLAILYGGCISFLQGKIEWFREHALAMPVIAGMGAVLYETVRVFVSKVQSQARVRQVENSRSYKVHLCMEGVAIDCIGILDTGNGLYEPIRGVPAAVLESRLFPEEKRGMPKAVIPYRSLGCQGGMLYGYTAHEVVLMPVDAKEQGGVTMEEMLVALYDGRLSSDGGYQILLHPDFFLTDEGNEKGGLKRNCCGKSQI